MSLLDRVRSIRGEQRKADLASYYQTPRWEELKTQRLAMDNGECVLCAKPATVVHHRRYQQVLGTETTADLVSLCQGCHYNYHSSPGLRETRKQLNERLMAGEQFGCPACDQNCKVYKRKLNSGMAAALCWMVKEYSGDWINVPESAPRFVLVTKEYATLRHWGLVEKMPCDSGLEDEADQAVVAASGVTGMWRPTNRGIEFVNRRLRVPRHVFLYNNRLLRFSDEDTDIVEALGDHFDYEELMRPAPVRATA
jgi:hypothetical protein